MRRTVCIAGGLLGAALVAFPIAMSNFAIPAIVLGIVSLGGFLVALATGRWIFAGPAALMFFVEYAVALVVDENRVDLAAPAVGFAALLLLELIDMSSLLALGGPVERAAVAARVRYVLVVGAAGFIVAFVGLLAAEWLQGNNYILVIAGAACGLAAVALTVLLARRAVGAGSA